MCIKKRHREGVRCHKRINSSGPGAGILPPGGDAIFLSGFFFKKRERKLGGERERGKEEAARESERQ